MSNEKKLITTALDVEDDIIDPARADWSAVVRLTVMDILDANDRPVLFAPVVVWSDDTWSRLTDTFDITTARQTCARLAAIHDKPVQDWTRPASLTFPREDFMWIAARSGHVPPERMNEVPETEPQWGAGWYLTDWLFLDGATDAEFLDSLAETERDTHTAFSKNGLAKPEDVSASLMIQNGEARRRWVMLHAANAKPRPGEIAL